MRDQTPVERALEILNVQEPPPTRQRPILCPLPDHDDTRPSALLYPDGGWYCHACVQGGSALDLYALRNGFTIRQALDRLGCFQDWTPVPKRTPKRVWMPESVKDILLSSGEFALRWEVAKMLSQVDPKLVKQDVLEIWDSLSERVDVPETLKLARLIRGVAFFKYVNPAKANDPQEQNRAVRQFLREIEAA